MNFFLVQNLSSVSNESFKNILSESDSVNQFEIFFECLKRKNSIKHLTLICFGLFCSSKSIPLESAPQHHLTVIFHFTIPNEMLFFFFISLKALN